MSVDTMGLDVRFGHLTFGRDASGPFATALVDVAIETGASSPCPDRIEMELRIAADPATDTVLDVVERARLQILASLRALTARLEAATSPDLLYRDDEGGSPSLG